MVFVKKKFGTAQALCLALIFSAGLGGCSGTGGSKYEPLAAYSGGELKPRLMRLQACAQQVQKDYEKELGAKGGIANATNYASTFLSPIPGVGYLVEAGVKKTLLADTYKKEQAEIDACMKRGGYRPATDAEKAKNLEEIQGLYQAKRL